MCAVWIFGVCAFVPIKLSDTIRHSVPVMLLTPAVVLVKLPGWVMVGTKRRRQYKKEYDNV